MSPSSDDDKAARKVAKKTTKAAVKALKKQGKPAGPAGKLSDGAAPAERSARAAEHKVLWKRRRFWLLVVNVLVALAALLLKVFGVVGF